MKLLFLLFRPEEHVSREKNFIDRLAHNSSDIARNIKDNK